MTYEYQLHTNIWSLNIEHLKEIQPFHPNKISESTSLEFITLNLLVRENKQGIVSNSIWFFPAPPTMQT